MEIKPVKRLFVENFRPNTTHNALLDLFQEKGKVDSITLHTGRRGDPLGYAFVVMENDCDAVRALRDLNNSDWNGLRLTVTSADYPTPVRRGFSGAPCAKSHR